MDLETVLNTMTSNPDSIQGTFTIDGIQNGKDEDFMAIATFMAKKSLQEKPTKIFGKMVPQPKIGAVLVVGNKAYCSARSGLKTGDHAEFTVVGQAKLNKENLANAILYTTLEPCTPISRKPWTESCSTLVIDERIKKVFVGSVDANPLITGMGIKSMVDNGIDVQFFIKKYVDDCIALNQDFFDFHSKIADAKTIKKIEDAIGNEIDYTAVYFYCLKKRQIKNLAEFDQNCKVWFINEMIMCGMIMSGDDVTKIRVTDSFALAFYEKPSRKIHGFSIDFYDERSAKKKTNATGIESGRNPIDNSVLIACKDFEKIDDKKTNIFSRLLDEYGYSWSSFGLDTLFKDKTSAREMIINAILHNDYSICPCISIKMFDDHIEIINACKIDDNDLRLLNHGEMPSVPQNPELMDIFEIAHLAEHHHFGMNAVQGDNIYSSSKSNSSEDDSIFSKQFFKGKQFLTTKISVR